MDGEKVEVILLCEREQISSLVRSCNQKAVESFLLLLELLEVSSD